MDYKLRDHTTNYVVGFRFSEDRDYFCGLFKLKPIWQAGFINGIGGAIEDNETALEAVKREFFEEAGKEINDWKQFAELILKGGNRIYFFKSFGDLSGIYSKTSEKVEIFEVDTLDVLNVIPNLKWLIPMALDKDNVIAIITDLS